MTWLARVMLALRRPAPLLPPELAWRIEITCDQAGTVQAFVSNYAGARPDAELYAAGTHLLVEAARQQGLVPEALLSALAHKYLKPANGHLSGRRIYVPR